MTHYNFTDRLGRGLPIAWRVAQVGVVVGLLSLAGPVTAHAQAAASDSGVGLTIMRGVYSRLGARLAAGAQDTSRRAWEISFPAADSARWEPHRRNLLRILRGRTPTATDSSVSSLSIGPWSVHGDTLTAAFSLGAKWRCWDGHETGQGTSYRITAVRRGTTWDEPRVVPEVFGDGICISKPPRGGPSR